MAKYLFANGPMPTTAAQAPIATGTGSAVKTHLQVKSVTAVQLRVIAWGVSLGAVLAGTPLKCELCETGTVFATVTAAVAADISKWDHPNNPTSTTFMAVGTTATGYNASAEGTITAVRMFDFEFVPPTDKYAMWFPLAERPVVDAVSALRVRITDAGVAVNAYAWVIVEPC